jgi:hypothetical protein
MAKDSVFPVWWSRIHRVVWDTLLLFQEGRCGIRGEATPDLLLDHDHRTGAIRGLLCQKCNNLVGQFENGQLSSEYQLTNQGLGDLVEAYLANPPARGIRLAPGDTLEILESPHQYLGH